MNSNRHTAEGGSPQGPTSYSRREAIASVAALSLAAATVASDAMRAMWEPETANDFEPDHELLVLGAAMEESWTAENRHDAATRDDFSQQACDEHEAICAITSSIVDRICALQATTLAGLLVKARAVSWCHCGDAIEINSFAVKYGATTDVILAASLTRDLLQMGEARNA
jgi:hypothetical protein